MSAENPFDISPFYPLCAFPVRENKTWIEFERKMIRAESGTYKHGEFSADNTSVQVSLDLEKAERID